MSYLLVLHLVALLLQSAVVFTVQGSLRAHEGMPLSPQVSAWTLCLHRMVMSCVMVAQQPYSAPAQAPSGNFGGSTSQAPPSSPATPSLNTACPCKAVVQKGLTPQRPCVVCVCACPCMRVVRMYMVCVHVCFCEDRGMHVCVQSDEIVTVT